MMVVDDSTSDRDNLSSVSTILGLSLLCLLIATILIRRVIVHSTRWRDAQQSLLAAANGVGVSGGVDGGNSKVLVCEYLLCGRVP
jgi:hypothetical protein